MHFLKGRSWRFWAAIAAVVGIAILLLAVRVRERPSTAGCELLAHDASASVANSGYDVLVTNALSETLTVATHEDARLFVGTITDGSTPQLSPAYAPGHDNGNDPNNLANRKHLAGTVQAEIVAQRTIVGQQNRTDITGSIAGLVALLPDDCRPATLTIVSDMLDTDGQAPTSSAGACESFRYFRKIRVVGFGYDPDGDLPAASLPDLKARWRTCLTQKGATDVSFVN